MTLSTPAQRQPTVSTAPDTPSPVAPAVELPAAMQELFPADYAAALSAQGALEGNATPMEHELAAGKVLALHAKELLALSNSQAIEEALVTNGYTVSPTARAALAAAAKRRNVTVTDQAIREFATFSGAYDAPGDAVKQFEQDVTKAEQHAADAAFATRYGSPNAGV